MLLYLSGPVTPTSGPKNLTCGSSDVFVSFHLISKFLNQILDRFVTHTRARNFLLLFLILFTLMMVAQGDRNM